MHLIKPFIIHFESASNYSLHKITGVLTNATITMININCFNENLGTFFMVNFILFSFFV